MGRAAYGAAALALMAGLGACGDDPDENAVGDPSPGTPSTSTSAPPPEEEQPPFKKLRRDFLAAGTATFGTTYDLGGTITRTGQYDLAGPASATEFTIPSETGGESVIRTVTVGEVSYTQFEGSGVSFGDCWLRYDNSEAAEIVGVAGVDVTFGLPAEVAVIDLADEVANTVTSDLYTVLATYSPKLAVAAGVSVDDTARTEIVLDVHSGGISGWHTSFEQVVADLEAGGFEVPDDLRTVAGLVRSELKVGFTRIGNDPTVEAPAKRDQVRVALDGGPAAMQAALQECTSR